MIWGILAMGTRPTSAAEKTENEDDKKEPLSAHHVGDIRFDNWLKKSESLLNENYKTTVNVALSRALEILPSGQLNHAADAVAFIDNLAQKPGSPDSFHVINVAQVAERYRFWIKHLKGVVPFYAVKTNPDPIIVQTLSALGTGFDCASEKEIGQVLATGADPSRIVYAHPRKSLSGIELARKAGVKRMTFDSEDELEKMLELFPEGEYILRIKTDDSHSIVPLNNKFGASMEKARELLRLAQEKRGNVIGISFHVGSNCTRTEPYRKGILDAAALFREAREKYGMKFTLLDLGGGWPGTNDTLFQEMACLVNSLIEENFDPDVLVIAEPGRFLSAPVVHIAAKIIGRDKLEDPNGKGEKQFGYYLSDGVYGSFLDSVYYQYNTELIKTEGVEFRPLKNPAPTPTEKLYKSTLWGPTCDSGDKIFEGILLPEMRRGDIIFSGNVGAYFTAMRTYFNGIEPSRPYYFYSDISPP